MEGHKGSKELKKEPSSSETRIPSYTETKEKKKQKEDTASNSQGNRHLGTMGKPKDWTNTPTEDVISTEKAKEEKKPKQRTHGSRLFQ